jgi:protein O-mannosyl-transferase
MKDALAGRAMSPKAVERSPTCRRGVPGSWLVVVAALAVFWPSLGAELVYDDWINFDRNQALRERDWWTLATSAYFGPDTTYWRPLTSLLMAAAYQVGGPGVHVLALSCHVLAAISVGAIARLLWQDERLAGIAALLFAVHPVQVESVAWISALPSVLSGMFVVLVVRAALSWSWRNGPGERRLPWSVVWLLLGAILAKESGVIALPLLAVVILSSPARGSAPARRLLVLTAAVCAAWFALRVAIVGHRPVLGEGFSWAAGAAQMVARQTLLLVWPWPLTPLRAPPFEVGSAALDAVALVAVVVFLWAVAARWGRFTPRWRVVTALLTIPILFAALTYDAVGPHPLVDRYLYVAVVGLALGVTAVTRRMPACALALLAVHGVLSLVQCHVWQNDRTFAEHVRAVSPHDAAARVLAGEAALRAGAVPDLPRAREEFHAALSLWGHRTDDYARRQRAAALAGLAWCDFHDTTTPEPVGDRLVEKFRAAIAHASDYVPAWVGLGVARGLQGRHRDALEAFERALALDPLCPEAWFNLGRTQLHTGRHTEAHDSLTRALRCNPKLTPATELLAALR